MDLQLVETKFYTLKSKLSISSIEEASKNCRVKAIYDGSTTHMHLILGLIIMIIENQWDSSINDKAKMIIQAKSLYKY